MDEESGVLGNLPRSRPGVRSEKRDTSPKRDTSARAARSAETRAAPAARPSGQERKRPTTPPQPEPASSDPVGEAVRTAAKLAGGGLKLANGLTREVLRRLPKP